MSTTNRRAQSHESLPAIVDRSSHLRGLWQGFEDDNAINRGINGAITTYEGHLFGRLNQAILLVNAMGGGDHQRRGDVVATLAGL